jgi:hypothetical protein
VKTICFVAFVIGIMTILPAAASADYRYDNRWMVTSPGAQESLVKYYGVYVDGVRYKVIAAKCTGDSSGDFAVNRGRGMYHRLICGVALRGTSTGAGLVFWQTGRGAYDYRTSDVSIYRR